VHRALQAQAIFVRRKAEIETEGHRSLGDRVRSGQFAPQRLVSLAALRGRAMFWITGGGAILFGLGASCALTCAFGWGAMRAQPTRGYVIRMIRGRITGPEVIRFKTALTPGRIERPGNGSGDAVLRR
jgi:hypothetical protein